MKKCLFVLASSLFSLSIAGQSKAGYTFPPQWAPQASVWLGWSTDSSIQSVHLQMARALAPQAGLTILSRSDSLLRVAFRQLHGAGIDTTHVKGYVHYIPNLFIRDAGPRFLQNPSGQKAIADFGWNNYGYPPQFDVFQYSDKRGEIDNALAQRMGLPVISTPIVAEGGGMDVNTDALLSIKEMALQRNPGKSLAQIEKEYLRLYGKRRMIWLNRIPLADKVVAGPKAGNYYGYGANGHVDEYVRFVNDSTIVVALIDPAEKDLDPVSAVDYHIQQENYDIVKKARRANGRPYHVVTLPTPAYSLYTYAEPFTEAMRGNATGKAMFAGLKEGDTIHWLANTSYANFFISNEVVLLAKYWRPGLPESERRKDEQARATLARLFPGKRIVQIDPMPLNINGGGMNCATQQEPR